MTADQVTNPEPTLPVARVARVEQVGGSWEVKVTCPRCGQHHYHSGGSMNGDPTLTFGEGTCPNRDPGGYVIAWTRTARP